MATSHSSHDDVMSSKLSSLLNLHVAADTHLLSTLSLLSSIGETGGKGVEDGKSLRELVERSCVGSASDFLEGISELEEKVRRMDESLEEVCAVTKMINEYSTVTVDSDDSSNPAKQIAACVTELNSVLSMLSNSKLFESKFSVSAEMLALLEMDFHVYEVHWKNGYSDFTDVDATYIGEILAFLGAVERVEEIRENLLESMNGKDDSLMLSATDVTSKLANINNLRTSSLEKYVNFLSTLLTYAPPVAPPSEPSGTTLSDVTMSSIVKQSLLVLPVHYLSTIVASLVTYRRTRLATTFIHCLAHGSKTDKFRTADVVLYVGDVMGYVHKCVVAEIEALTDAWTSVDARVLQAASTAQIASSSTDSTSDLTSDSTSDFSSDLVDLSIVTSLNTILSSLIPSLSSRITSTINNRVTPTDDDNYDVDDHNPGTSRIVAIKELYVLAGIVTFYLWQISKDVNNVKRNAAATSITVNDDAECDLTRTLSEIISTMKSIYTSMLEHVCNDMSTNNIASMSATLIGDLRKIREGNVGYDSLDDDDVLSDTYIYDTVLLPAVTRCDDIDDLVLLKGICEEGVNEIGKAGANEKWNKIVSEKITDRVDKTVSSVLDAFLIEVGLEELRSDGSNAWKDATVVNERVSHFNKSLIDINIPDFQEIQSTKIRISARKKLFNSFIDEYEKIYNIFNKVKKEGGEVKGMKDVESLRGLLQ